uniref:Uncharacterized protein n=1 Tax=Anguilla anguilla TaxID=7936 RepID=A0A0E9P7X8_ANGAN
MKCIDYLNGLNYLLCLLLVILSCCRTLLVLEVIGRVQGRRSYLSPATTIIRGCWLLGQTGPSQCGVFDYYYYYYYYY